MLWTFFPPAAAHRKQTDLDTAHRDFGVEKIVVFMYSATHPLPVYKMFYPCSKSNSKKSNIDKN